MDDRWDAVGRRRKRRRESDACGSHRSISIQPEQNTRRGSTTSTLSSSLWPHGIPESGLQNADDRQPRARVKPGRGNKGERMDERTEHARKSVSSSCNIFPKYNMRRYDGAGGRSSCQSKVAWVVEWNPRRAERRT